MTQWVQLGCLTRWSDISVKPEIVLTRFDVQAKTQIAKFQTHADLARQHDKPAVASLPILVKRAER